MSEKLFNHSRSSYTTLSQALGKLWKEWSSNIFNWSGPCNINRLKHRKRAHQPLQRQLEEWAEHYPELPIAVPAHRMAINQPRQVVDGE